jgi:hypothetical protein
MVRVVVIGALVLAVATAVVDGIAERRAHRRVAALLEAPNWDWKLPAVANWSNHQARLTAHAADIVPVLRKDLNFDPAAQRWCRKLPHAVARFVEPAPGRASEMVRAHAAYHLARLGPAARAAIPDLIGRAEDSNELVRYNVAVALAAIGEDTPQIRAVLAGMITNVSFRLGPIAAFALWRIDLANTNSLARLAFLRPDSLISLGPIIARMRNAARPILPAIREAIPEIPDYHSRLSAVRNYWLASGDVELPMALVREQIAVLRESATNTIDRAAPSRSLNHLASAALQLGEIPEVREELRMVLKELQSSGDNASKPEPKFIAEELDRIEKWQQGALRSDASRGARERNQPER